jgi:hypothetical protein
MNRRPAAATLDRDEFEIRGATTGVPPVLEPRHYRQSRAMESSLHHARRAATGQPGPGSALDRVAFFSSHLFDQPVASHIKSAPGKPARATAPATRRPLSLNVLS